ncbi:MAG: 50S ribosomal protein L22, partial [Mycobacterium sp.]|nr:50S ribosomal protein L22 [Mycobacterium sp.]
RKRTSHITVVVETRPATGERSAKSARARRAKASKAAAKAATQPAGAPAQVTPDIANTANISETSAAKGGSE